MYSSGKSLTIKVVPTAGSTMSPYFISFQVLFTIQMVQIHLLSYAANLSLNYGSIHCPFQGKFHESRDLAYFAQCL